MKTPSAHGQDKSNAPCDTPKTPGAGGIGSMRKGVSRGYRTDTREPNKDSWVLSGSRAAVGTGKRAGEREVSGGDRPVPLRNS